MKKIVSLLQSSTVAIRQQKKIIMREGTLIKTPRKGYIVLIM